MSRWVNEFENFKSGPWSGIKLLVDNINLEEFKNPVQKQELARLKKLVTFISNFLNTLDPELISAVNLINVTSVANSFSSNLERRLDIMVNNNSSLDHVQRINSDLDQIFLLFSPFIAPEIQPIQDITKEIKVIKQNKFDAEKFKKEIQKYAIELFGSEKNIGDDKSLKSKIEKLYIQFERQQQEIKKFHESLTKGDTTENAIIKQINDTRDTALKSKNLINEKLHNAETQLESLEIFHEKIFGTTDSNGNTVGGLEHELDERKNKLDTFNEEQQEIIKGLIEKINTLLPAATSAGLASAYRESKEGDAKKTRRYTVCFALSVVFLLVAGIAIARLNPEISNLEQLFYKLFISSPIFTPLIWLCLFTSKRRSEYSRLEQEYAHKEALAKSYGGYKKEITELESEDKLLLTSLLGAAVDSLAFNPSTTLDKKHGDTTPIAGANINFLKNSRQDGH